MLREVVSERDVAAAQSQSLAVAAGAETLSNARKGTPSKADEYTTRLLKYVPTEVVTLYLFVVGVAATATSDS